MAQLNIPRPPPFLKFDASGFILWDFIKKKVYYRKREKLPKLDKGPWSKINNICELLCNGVVIAVIGRWAKCSA